METTLGIDLAAQPKNTGVCVVEWATGRAQVSLLARGSWNDTKLHDEFLVRCINGQRDATDRGWGTSGAPVMTAIDAPFGWPDDFVDALVLHRRGEPWPAPTAEQRSRLVRRHTDRVVGKRAKLPLAVAADRIAYPAMRCAVLLSQLVPQLGAEQLARDGSGRVCEVYPDAALRCWMPDAWVGPKPDSYKGDAASAVARREGLLAGLLDGIGAQFAITEQQRAACVDSDDILDALVCALLARAVQLRRTLLPKAGEETGRALREGWIHLPDPDSLRDLVA